MTNENKFFALSIVVVLIIAGIISYSYFKPRNSYSNSRVVAKAPTNNSTNQTSQPISYSLQAVAKHNTAADCWQVINNKVYDVTGAIAGHPGGAEAIIQFCGQDATTGFSNRNGKGPHPQNAQENLISFYIGDLK